MGVPLEHRGNEIIAVTKREGSASIKSLSTALQCEPDPAMRKLIALCLASLHAGTGGDLQQEELEAALRWSLRD